MGAVRTFSSGRAQSSRTPHSSAIGRLRDSNLGVGRFFIWKYPNPDSRSLPPLRVPSPYFILAIATLIGLAAVFALFLLVSDRAMAKEPRPVLALEQIVGPQHCRGAADPWACMQGAGE